MRFIEFLKPILGTVIIIALLQATGLMGTVSFLTQSAALHSGLLNAGSEELTEPTEFDYNFAVKDLTGKRVSFEQFKGKVVFINLWATWCGPCRAEMADIQKLYSKIGKENNKIAFVMLSIDEDRNKAKVESYIHNKAFTFPVFMPSGYLSEQLNVPSIPTTFVISKDGKIIMKEVGTKNYNTDKFKKFLEEKANN